MKHLFKFGKKACASMAWVTLFLGAAPWVAAQEAYPNKPIRMLLGYPPGGGSDIIARLIAKPLGDRLGQSVVVDNKPGASGNIAAEMAARANPDGYTLLFVPSGLATSAAMKKSMPFQPVNDFFWISTVTTPRSRAARIAAIVRSEMVLLCGNSVPSRSITSSLIGAPFIWINLSAATDLRDARASGEIAADAHPPAEAQPADERAHRIGLAVAELEDGGGAGTQETRQLGDQSTDALQTVASAVERNPRLGGEGDLREVSRRRLDLGVALEAAFFVCLLVLLSRSDVSFVWPLTAIGFVLTTVSAIK